MPSYNTCEGKQACQSHNHKRYASEKWIKRRWTHQIYSGSVNMTYIHSRYDRSLGLRYSLFEVFKMAHLEPITPKSFWYGGSITKVYSSNLLFIVVRSQRSNRIYSVYEFENKRRTLASRQRWCLLCTPLCSEQKLQALASLQCSLVM